MYVQTPHGIVPNPDLQKLFGTGAWTERLKRFVEPGALPEGVAAMVDDDKNILYVDREIYEGVSERVKNRLWRLTSGKMDYYGKEIIF